MKMKFTGMEPVTLHCIIFPQDSLKFERHMVGMQIFPGTKEHFVVVVVIVCFVFLCFFFFFFGAVQISWELVK